VSVVCLEIGPLELVGVIGNLEIDGEGVCFDIDGEAVCLVVDEETVYFDIEGDAARPNPGPCPFPIPLTFPFIIIVGESVRLVIDGECICLEAIADGALFKEIEGDLVCCLDIEGEFVCLDIAGEGMAPREVVVLREGGCVIVPLRKTDVDQRASHR